MNTIHTIDLIIPAYNEEHRIEPTLRSYLDYFGDRLHIVVVLNGCTDNTEAVVRRVQKKHAQYLDFHVVEEPIGKGGTILYGWQNSQAEYVGFIDADGSTAPTEFEKLVEHIGSTTVGVIASRFLDDSKIIDRQNMLRTTMSRVFAMVVKLLFRMPYTDTQCGAKLFKREDIKQVLSHVHSTDMTFDVDLLWQLHKRNVHAEEISTIWVDKPGSASLDSKKSFMLTGVNMVIKLWQLRFRKQ